MKIGEFARMAGMPISVLRHYDREGLLRPDYVDRFSGYRYYSAGQIGQVQQIELLKRCGLSLKEIKDILQNADDGEMIKDILLSRESQYTDMLAAIEEVKRMMTEREQEGTKRGQENPAVVEENTSGELIFKGRILPQPLNAEDFQAACRSLEEEIQKNNYQRISGFLTYGEKDKAEIQLAAKVVKLREEIGELHEDINLLFQEDDQVVGKWKVVGEYAVKEDFYSRVGEKRESPYGNKDREIYFLPGGEDYWIYSWTRGYLKLDGGYESCLCRYQVEDYEGSRYMFVENKSYEYLRGGMPTVLVLEQVDNKKYTRREIAREEDTNLPFVNDERVLGDWKAFDFIRTKEEFSPGEHHLPQDRLYYKHMHFGEGGCCVSVYQDQTISGRDVQSWTKGYVLKHFNHTACAYEIVTVDDTDYMIIEWKSGDYRWGGYDTDYYVFVRE
ncbi:MAG: helix-turn-helix domain-containing protein [Butyrivibrio sp.]|nr:helix-turn-helix domain-containing protein [Acetatifactor muris]MCM1558556.1 helix-turn-helix domain-containing protein [Butyrivibrio sp.]